MRVVLSYTIEYAYATALFVVKLREMPHWLHLLLTVENSHDRLLLALCWYLFGISVADGDNAAKHLRSRSVK